MPHRAWRAVVRGFCAALLATSAVQTAEGQNVARPGDIIALSYVACRTICPPPGDANVYGPDGTFRFVASNQRFEFARILSGLAGEIFISTADGTIRPSVLRYGPGLRDPTEFPPVGPVADLAMDGRGQLYALDYGTRLKAVDVANKTATVEAVFVANATPAEYTYTGDLSPDQCTFASATQMPTEIKRYDICRGVELTPIPLPPAAAPTCDAGSFEAPKPTLRYSSDGAIFIAACGGVYRLNGSDVRRYEMPAGHQKSPFAFTADYRSFWSASSSSLVEIDVATGAVLRTVASSPPHPPTGLVVYGVPRAAVVAGTTAIPTLSPLALSLFAMSLAGIAFVAIRR